MGIRERVNPYLVVEKEGFLDVLKYLNPKTWIPAKWKKSIKGAISGEVEYIPPSEEEIAHGKIAVATDIFLSKLSVNSIQWSNVLTIEIDSYSPVLAARIANDLPEAYMVDQLQAKFDATEKATAWVPDRKSSSWSMVVKSSSFMMVFIPPS